MSCLQEEEIVLICGHYEGIDARVTELLHAEDVSIGDFVLTGGELPAMVIVDAVTRLIPGVIDDASIAEESHQEGLLEYPHYTRPAEYRGLARTAGALERSPRGSRQMASRTVTPADCSAESDVEVRCGFANLSQHPQTGEVTLGNRAHIDRQRCLRSRPPAPARP